MQNLKTFEELNETEAKQMPNSEASAHLQNALQHFESARVEIGKARSALKHNEIFPKGDDTLGEFDAFLDPKNKDTVPGRVQTVIDQLKTEKN